MFNEILEKKQDELTVSDSLKLTAAATAITVVVPVAIFAGIGAVGSIKNFIKERKNEKNTPKLEK